MCLRTFLHRIFDFSENILVGYGMSFNFSVIAMKQRLMWQRSGFWLTPSGFVGSRPGPLIS